MKTNNEPLTLDNAKLSQQTLNYINCQRALSDLYSQIITAITAQYGDNNGNADDLFRQDFAPAFDKLDDVFGRYIYQSIKDQQAPVASTTI